MRAPRRTPYEHPNALGQVYQLLYPDEQCEILPYKEYIQLRERGLAIVQVWLNRCRCPHAVESTNSLIQSQNLDQNLLLLSSTSNFTYESSSEWMVRSTYSMAIVRFVNSVVDAYQTALYAQSIFQISQKIGLPAHLVEIRHAATHEELPSLDVLRNACTESLKWLQVNFWQPTLNKKNFFSQPINGRVDNTLDELRSTIEMDEVRRTQGKELIRCIARYRRLAKKVTKDESLKGRYKVSLVAAERKVETFAKQMASEMRRIYGATFLESESKASSLVAEALLEEGCLVPLSKKKRPRIDNTEEIVSLPSRLLQLWLPLLKHLAASLESFHEALQEEMVKKINLSDQSRSSSYLDTVASWLMTLYGADTSLLNTMLAPKDNLLYSDISEEDAEARITEKPTLELARRLLTGQNVRALSLVRLLCQKNPDLREKIASLLELAQTSLITADTTTTIKQGNTHGQEDLIIPDSILTEASDVERSIAEMEQNLKTLEDSAKFDHSQARSKIEIDHPKFTDTPRAEEQASICQHLSGWSIASSDWKPTPIGCLDGSVPNLLLAL